MSTKSCRRLQDCNFIKNKITTHVFPREFCKILRITYLQNISGRLLLFLWKRIIQNKSQDRSSHSQMFYGKDFLRISQNSQENTLASISF